MNLALVVALAVSFLLAFTIGLNLGLHGVLSVGDKKVLVRANNNVLEDNTFQEDNASAHNVKSDAHGVHDESDVAATNDAEDKSLNSIVQISDSSNSALSVLHKIYEGKTVRDAMGGINVESSKGAIATYLEAGGKIPIVLLTCSRPDQLRGTLKSLLAVRGVSRDNLLVAQDGAMQQVADVVKEFGLDLLQNKEGLRLRGGVGGDGAQRIAKHYKYSLSAAFDRAPDAPAIIITEDDLLFSPDFYEYLVCTAPILETDPTTFVVSAWNDNGFKDKVLDVSTIKRTEFFPGLGWLLPRELYKKELEERWPTEHWDHWLRSVEVHGARDIIYPEVPRTYHNGIIGTFMNLETHNKYFRDVAYNTDESVKWNIHTGIIESRESSLPVGTPNYLKAMESVDRARIESLTKECTNIKTFSALMETSGVLCVWVDIDPFESQGGAPDFEPIASFFGIWHEHRRGAHRGLHELHWDDNYVLILNVRTVSGEQSYKHLMPSSAVLIDPKSFDKTALVERSRKKIGLEGVPAGRPGMTCDEVCAVHSLTCRGDLLPLLNTCQALNSKFPCRNCIHSFGTEQPAFVSTDAPLDAGPGTCVVSTQPDKSICSASHELTHRLCACA